MWYTKVEGYGEWCRVGGQGNVILGSDWWNGNGFQDGTRLEDVTCKPR